MNEVVIWHNPRCTKSREALKLLEDRGLTPVIRLYLNDPPSAEELRETLGKLGLRPVDLMRTREAAFREQGLSRDMEDERLLSAMVATPKLIERPVVLANGAAALGRPPEAVLDIL